MKPNPAKKRVDDAVEFISTWIQERVEYAAKVRGRWFDELTEWAENAEARVKSMNHNHYNEPPIPTLLGFVAEAAANHNIGSTQGDLGGYEKVYATGLLVAATHGQPQTSLTDPMCPNSPFPRSWVEIKNGKTAKPGKKKKR